MASLNQDTMSEHSKQWADLNDPEFPWDFDIELEFESIPHGFYKPIICEGFGFIGLERDAEGKELLLFPKGDTVERVPYLQFLEQQKH